jgi:hypothetical protein
MSLGWVNRREWRKRKRREGKVGIGGSFWDWLGREVLILDERDEEVERCVLVRRQNEVG